MGIKERFNRVLKAWNGQDVRPLYSKVNDGTHSYNYEVERHLLSFLSSSKYYSPVDNYKCYYEQVIFFSSVIDCISDYCCSVEFKEVDSNDKEIEGSEIVNLLNNPNLFQDKQQFIKEAVINILTTGLNTIYGDFFKGGDLAGSINRLYNIDTYNIKFQEIRNRYLLTSKDYNNIKLVEVLDYGNKRNYTLDEVCFIYDSMNKQTYGGKDGYDSKKFMLPISRVSSLLYDLEIIKNTQDTMSFLTHSPVMGVLSRDGNNQFAPLPEDQKRDIEKKVSGRSIYGSSNGKLGNVIATNEQLKYLDISKDFKKTGLIEAQNNAKENIRTRFNIPREIIDAYNGTSRGATYENQQYQESSFILTVPKKITDSIVKSIEKKLPKYFGSRGTKLIGSYDHLPSIINTKELIKNQGLKFKMEVLATLISNYNLAKESGITLDFNTFLKNNGFEDLL